MNKGKLIDQLAMDCRISKKQAGVIISTITNAIASSLSQRRRINISGLGVFSVYQREPKKGVHPRNGSSIMIASKPIARLKTGLRLMQELNEGN